jgi:hypothetical protein
LYRYDLATDTLAPIGASNYWYTAGSALSPASKLIAVGLAYRQSDAENGYRTLYLFDFAKDQMTPIAELPVGQTFASYFNAFDGGAVADLHWVDAQTIEYGVYDLPDSSAAQFDAPNKLIEHRQLTLL